MSLEGLGAVTSVLGAVGNIAKAVTPIVGATAAATESIAAGRAAQQEAEYAASTSELESEMALRSAAMTRQNAQIARTAAGIEAARLVSAGRALTGTQASVIAKAGIEVGGSPLLAMMETVRKSHEDAVLARWKGDVTATGLEEQVMQTGVKAEMLKNQAKMLRARGRRTLLGGVLTAPGTALSGYANASLLSSKLPTWTPAVQTTTAQTGYEPSSWY
jgi:hypothetical protein